MIKKVLIIIFCSLILTGCWFTRKKTSSKVANRPPLPKFKNKIKVQITRFQNESRTKYLNYLSKTIIPYLREYLKQIKKIRFKEKERIISNILSIRNYFINKQKASLKNAGIIFDILNNQDIPGRFLTKEYLQKRNKKKQKIIQEKKEKEKVKQYREFLVKKFTESDAANKINEKINEIKKEINEKIEAAEKSGKPYSKEDKEKLVNNDPRIISLNKALKTGAFKMGGLASGKKKNNNAFNYESRFENLSLFQSNSLSDEYFVKKSIALNKEYLKKNKKLNFIGLNIFDFEEKTSMTASFEINSQEITINNFNFSDPNLAGNSVAKVNADLIITGKFRLDSGNIILNVVGYEKNNSNFLFNIKNSISLQSFELEIQKYIKNISKDIINSISRVRSNPLIVRTNVETGIVYMNNKDVGRTNYSERGQKYAELFIPAVPVGFNLLEVVKKGYFNEKGYIFINPTTGTYSIDIVMKKHESDISLKVIAEPKKAVISVGMNVLKGNPAVAKNLERGYHRITVSAPGYETRRISVEVFPNIKNFIKVKLKKKNKDELSPEKLMARYNFWKNFFFLGSMPLLGGMIYTQLVMDHQYNKVSETYSQASSTSGSEQDYWNYEYNKSSRLYRLYVGHNNFFRVSLGISLLLSGLFQYLESDLLDKDDIGLKKIPELYTNPVTGNFGIGFNIKF